MANNRRPRIDSTAARARVISQSAAPVSPPSNVPLDKEDMPFFASVIAEYARSEWSEHELELAAMLARKMCDMEREQRLLRAEGSVLSNARGNPIQNPRAFTLRALDTSILAMRRSLAIDSRAKGGDKRDIDKRASIAKEVEADSPLGDDLLARPN
jgi:hypothetical protein